MVACCYTISPVPAKHPCVLPCAGSGLNDKVMESADPEENVFQEKKCGHSLLQVGIQTQSLKDTTCSFSSSFFPIFNLVLLETCCYIHELYSPMGNFPSRIGAADHSRSPSTGQKLKQRRAPFYHTVASFVILCNPSMDDFHFTASVGPANE